MRRELILPDEDIEFLDSLNLDWETIREGNQEWLIVQKIAVPTGYLVDKADVAILIASGYPSASLDMAFFIPALQRTDGKSINNVDVMQPLDGKSWQRWSRHRSVENPWQPGIDNITTHLISIRYWLEREFVIKP